MVIRVEEQKKIAVDYFLLIEMIMKIYKKPVNKCYISLCIFIAVART
jgi:hypothetical protein